MLAQQTIMIFYFSLLVINDSRRNDNNEYIRNSSENSSDNFNIGLLLGVSLAPFCWYMSTVSFIAVHFYWFLPVIKRGTVHVSDCKYVSLCAL